MFERSSFLGSVGRVPVLFVAGFEGGAGLRVSGRALGVAEGAGVTLLDAEGASPIGGKSLRPDGSGMVSSPVAAAGGGCALARFA